MTIPSVDEDVAKLDLSYIADGKGKAILFGFFFKKYG